MKIFLTGHRGYLGQCVIQKLGGKYNFVGFDLADRNDIGDVDSLTKAMQGCDQVVHLAAIPRPLPEKSLQDYIASNVQGTANVAEAAVKANLKRIVYASSTTVYGVEKGIPFQTPITEAQPILSQYMTADHLECRECDLSYHISKVMAEQIMAWYGLNKKIQTLSLRFGPIGKVFLGTSVSNENAVQAIDLAIQSHREFWYEPFSIVDEIEHIDISKAKELLGYSPEKQLYTPDQIRSTFEDRYRLP